MVERRIYTAKVVGSIPTPPTMTIPIVYEDSDILVINKPTGILTHPKNKNDKSGSIVGWLLKEYPEIKNVGDDPALRPGIVHRLDKNTSGLLIIAKTQSAFDYLKIQFQERKIKKTYIALVHGKVKQNKGEILAPLGKIGAKQTTRIKGKKDLKEKEAITQYKVSKRIGGFTLLEVSPLTGRTHQIRVHLNSIGHSIVGDYTYGKKQDNLKRFFLHAFKLEFTTPSGKRMFLEADLPSELQSFLAGLENR